LFTANGFGDHGLNVGALMLILSSRNQYRTWLNKAVVNGGKWGISRNISF
jgi:hypothetical protein